MFKFEGKDFRAAIIDENPWFVAQDVADVLGYTRVDNMLRGVAEDEKTFTPPFLRGTGYLHHRCILISESGLYKLIMRAHPNANPVVKRFQDWVTREVLPALRKDGMYVMGEEKVKTGEMSHHLPRKPAGYEVIIARQ